MKALKAIVPVMSLMLAACGGHDKGWEVKGDVYGAEGEKMALESYNNGNWYVVDSVQVDHRGQFAYASPEAAHYPEIFRLTLGDRSIYFPVDSVDHIRLTTSKDDFGTSYQLSGTADATSVAGIDSMILAETKTRGNEAVIADKEFKKRLLKRALESPTVVTAYYLVNKSLGGKPLFDLADRSDLRFYGAVAQRFATERPDDSRGEYLKNRFLAGQRALRPAQVTEFEAEETGLFDIVRYDAKGNKQSLAEMAGKGGVTVLSFTAYGMETSPAYNVILNGIYEKYKANGLKIYQIAFDADETAWRNTARNLPWTAVWNSTTDGNEVLARYNVAVLPTTFVIDRSGALAARVTDPEKIEAEVSRHI